MSIQGVIHVVQLTQRCFLKRGTVIVQKVHQLELIATVHLQIGPSLSAYYRLRNFGGTYLRFVDVQI